MIQRIIRKVASRWAYAVSMRGWNPPIPEWVFEKWGSRLALQAPNADMAACQLAKESVNIMIPNLLALLQKRLKDRYHMNASQRGTDVFYFFSTRHPVDSISMHFGIRQGNVVLSMGWVPYKISSNQPDWGKAIEKKALCKDPELAGLALMRLARTLLDAIPA